MTTESLSILINNQKVEYLATVPTQNQAKTISFILNPKVKECFSFENMDHDFPKKIQYHKINAKKVQAVLIGERDEEVRYFMIKQ